MMNSNKRIARVTAALFLTATAAGLLSVIFLEPINTPDYLVTVSANESRVIMGSLFILTMAFAVAGIAIVMYPALRAHNESMAIGYVAARSLEGALFIVGAISLLSLLTISQEYVRAGTPAVSHFQTLGELLRAARGSGPISFLA